MPVPEPGTQRLADVIKAARADLRWTQRVLAQEARVSVETVKRYESGKSRWPEPENVRKIFTAMRLNVLEIPIILGLLTRDEMTLPAQPVEPAIRRFDHETEQIIALLTDSSITTAERRALVELLQARRTAPAARDKRQPRAG